MSASRDRQIVIELVVRSRHPSLLAGLDAWLQLGLISDEFVRQLSEAELSCALPVVVPVAVPAIPSPDEASDTSALEPVAVTSRRRPPNLLSQALQAFMAEISVVWLLFLGVFLVVVSSGVLAATQWQNFSLLGQYGILLAYTVAFAIASLAARSRPVLQLTSRMLTIATLLLIPVNFWMMDGFRLWRQAGGLALIAIAAVGLTGIIIMLLRRSEPRLLIAVVILLSWLHWGWQQPGIPLIATYIGTLGATAALLVHDRQRPQLAPVSGEVDPEASSEVRSPTAPTLSPIAIALAATLLIGRALFAAQVPIQQLGLAIAGCGWLLCWLARRDRSRLGWSRAGTVLMGLGWLVTVGETPPWQAIAISGFGLQLLHHALWRTGRAAYLVAGFGVGGQLLWLGWRVFPATWQTQLVSWATQLAGSTGMPLALLGLGFFPYVMLTAGFALHLRRRDRAPLAWVAEWLALALGAGLIAVSLSNPLVRSLTLTLASLTLLTVVRYRQPLPTALVYLTHGTLLAAVLAWVDQLFPALASQQWVLVLLGLMAVHWGYGAGLPLRWEWEGKSSWHFGLLLAAASYALLWEVPPNLPPVWIGSWLITPILLTVLSYRDRFPATRLAAGLSVLALLLIQPLTLFPSDLRLASLTIATLLLLANTQKLQKLPAAVLTVGFGLGLWAFTLYEIGRSWFTFDWVLVLVAVTVVLLWGIRGLYQSRRSHLAQLYRVAVDGWAIAVFLLACLLISLSQILVWLQQDQTTWPVILACGLLVLATSYRTFLSPSDAGWFAIAVSLELLTVSSLLLAGRSRPALAIANIGLGFLAQMAGNWAIRRAGGRRQEAGGRGQGSGVRRQEVGRERQGAEDSQGQISTRLDYPISWHLIPLMYGGLSLWLAHLEFTATTGLYTLAIAILGCQIGRRSPRLTGITYLSLVGLSWGAFELLIYQLSVAKGGNPGDGITLLAGLAIALTWFYQAGRRYWGRWLRLAAAAFDPLIQAHWMLGTGLLGLAVVSSLSRTGQSLWTAIAVGYAAYALLTSRSGQTARRMTQAWLYAGIWQLLAAIAAALWLLLPTGVLIDWAGAIAAGLAVLLYRLPWQRWGWLRSPGQQSAVVLPAVVLVLTGWGANLQSLLLAAAFYTWLAIASQQIRFSYIGVLLADWALIRLLFQFNLTQPLWFAAIAGGSMLYLAQVDPELQTQERYEQRHWVRSLATGLICLTGFYQAETGITGLSPFVAGFVAIAIEFGFILWGLVQRVRAFLYVGTLSFLLQIFWQLWRFMRDYSLVLWLVGIVVGLLLIWVAATFEARRTQANALLQHWVTELEAWQ